jgi:hypothetical protein
VPAQASTLPEGVYRVEIPVESVTDAGISNGPGWSGTWTLQIKDGTFALTCRPLDEPGKDCGNTVSNGVFEAGDLRGQGHRVYFVGNVELLAALSGCSNDPGAPEDKQCHGGEPYSAVWSMEGNQLTFSDATVYHLSLRPWTRIASTR